MQTIFDIGMYDGADTSYYLASGYRVVAVEANPELVDQAIRKFEDQLLSGRLICINAAVSCDGNPIELTIAGTDLGSSTLFPNKIVHKKPGGSFTVPGVTLQHLFEQFGIPKYLKVDIEGADRFCVLSLTETKRPAYLSFEIGDDVDELLLHSATIGYTKFKIINQNTFLQFRNARFTADQCARKIMRRFGCADPKLIKRAGDFFIPGHSSGPVPWKSDGRWQSYSEIKSILDRFKLPGWNDIHATSE